MPLKGYKQTPEHREKTRLNALGNKKSLGKKRSPEQIRKVVETTVKRYSEGILIPWNKGINTTGIPLHKYRRKWKDYKVFREACMIRDNYTCQKTGSKTDLVVHHIKPYLEYPHLAVSVENGITLSQEAHRDFHKRYGKKGNTLLQIEEFIGKKLSTLARINLL